MQAKKYKAELDLKWTPAQPAHCPEQDLEQGLAAPWQDPKTRKSPQIPGSVLKNIENRPL